MTDNVEMRMLFEGAIKLQQDIIADANRRIEHYRWALAEMDRQENIINLADVKPLEIQHAIVDDVA